MRLVATLSLLVVTGGCHLQPDPAFAVLGRSFELRIVEASRGQAAGSVDFEFELTNGGDSAAAACFGPSRTVSYRTASGGGSSVQAFYHPGCEYEFTIASGKAMRFRETLSIPELSSAPTAIEVEIEVVNPRRCGGFGCASIHVKSLNRRDVM